MHRAPLPLSLVITVTTATLLGACDDFDPTQALYRYAHRDSTEAPAPPVAPQRKVLFIGNSLTYYNDLPSLVQSLDASIAAESVTAGGVALSAHWSAGAAPLRIAQGHYTHVVLQERTYEPLTNPVGFHDYVRRFASAAEATGAKPVIFEAWAHRDQSDEMYANPWSGGSPDAMQSLLLA